MHNPRKQSMCLQACEEVAELAGRLLSLPDRGGARAATVERLRKVSQSPKLIAAAGFGVAFHTSSMPQRIPVMSFSGAPRIRV